MFEFTGLADMKGWMRGDRPTGDAAGATLRAGVRGHLQPRAAVRATSPPSRTPGRCPADQEKRVPGADHGRIPSLAERRGFHDIYLDDLSALERRILFERNLVSQGYSVEKHKAHGAQRRRIGRGDHRGRGSPAAGRACKPGRAWKPSWRGWTRWTTQLEGSLPYAVSPEWGYLNTAITNLGTGLKASMMLHLPALAMSGLIKRAVKASAQLGLSIRGFFSESMESLGDMYIIANEITIGLAEKEIIGNLGRIAVQLAGYENRTREELMEKRRVDIEDRVYRAWGLLTWCRYLTHREAIEALSALRLGVSLGLVASVDASTITALLFLSQKSHIQRVLQSHADAADGKLIDYTRAKIIREALTQPRGG